MAIKISGTTVIDDSRNITNLGSALTAAQGGTGATTLTTNNVILGNGTSAVQFVAPSTTGNVLTSNGTTWASAALPAGGLTYVVKTANYTTKDKEGVLADTSGGAFTVTLPATPATGAQVVVADSGSFWGTNNLTIARNSSTIGGLAENLICDITGASVQLVYDGSTWEVYAQIGGNGGTAVTLAGVQTLTNKTINGTNNTLTVRLANDVTGTLPIANGGTGSTSTTFANLATNVTGTLPVANGGTGAATLTTNNVLLGNGTSAVQVVAPGTSGNVLTSDGTTWASTAPSGAALVYLSTTTTASSASLSISLTSFTSSYSAFKLVCTNVSAAVTGTTATIELRINNTTSNYKAGAGGGRDVQGAGQLAWGNRKTDAIALFPQSIGFLTDDTGHVANFEINLFNMDASARKFFVGYSGLAFKVGSSGGVGAGGGFGGMWENAATPTALNVVAADNFAGTFILYGIKTS